MTIYPHGELAKTIAKFNGAVIIRQLIAAGFLHLDIEQYGGLSLTPKGGELLRGHDSFSYRPAVQSKKEVSRSHTKPAYVTINLSPEKNTVFEKLRALRRELAGR